VESPSSPTLVELQSLQLEDARALLDHELSLKLPPVEESATRYLQEIINGLCELSLKDPLTGLANRRQFDAVLERSIDVVARSGEPALLLMIDIDHFKHVNDSYGHPTGDLILQTVAQCLAKCVRPMDTVARYGGEEFAVVLPNCHTAFGITIAERIREAVASLVTTVSPGVNIKITVSLGGAYAPEWVRSTAAQWTERADVQLYRAKEQGRNRVRIDPQPEIFVSAEEKNLLFGHLALTDPAWIENVANDPSGGTSSASNQRVN